MINSEFKKNNYKIIISIFCLALTILYSYFKMFDILNSINNVLYLAVLYLMFFIRIMGDADLKNKVFHDKKMMYMIALAGIFTLVTGITTLSLYFLVYIAFCQYEKKTFFKSFFLISLLLFISIIFLNKIGILESNNYVRFEGSFTHIRTDFGFGNPNLAFLLLFTICLSINYVYYNNIFLDFVTLIILFMFFGYTQTRTGIMCAIIFFAIKYMSKFIVRKILKKDYEKFKINKIFRHSFLLFSILTILFCLIFKNSTLAANINLTLSNRLYYWQKYVNTDLITNFFGLPLLSKTPLDNTYLFILRNLGTMAFVIVGYIYFKGMRNLKCKDFIFILSFLIYGLFEYNMVIIYNFSLIILFNNIFLNNQSNVESVKSNVKKNKDITYRNVR